MISSSLNFDFDFHAVCCCCCSMIKARQLHSGSCQHQKQPSTSERCSDDRSERWQKREKEMKKLKADLKTSQFQLFCSVYVIAVACTVARERATLRDAVICNHLFNSIFVFCLLSSIIRVVEDRLVDEVWPLTRFGCLMRSHRWWRKKKLEIFSIPHERERLLGGLSRLSSVAHIKWFDRSKNV